MSGARYAEIRQSLEHKKQEREDQYLQTQLRQERRRQRKKQKSTSRSFHNASKTSKSRTAREVGTDEEPLSPQAKQSSQCQQELMSAIEESAKQTYLNEHVSRLSSTKSRGIERTTSVFTSIAAGQGHQNVGVGRSPSPNLITTF